MNSYLVVAYAIFCLAPLGLAASIALRRRRVERKVAALEAVADREDQAYHS